MGTAGGRLEVDECTLQVHCLAGVWLNASNQATKTTVVLLKSHRASPGLVSGEMFFYSNT